MYNAIKDISNVALVANLENSQHQIINYGIKLLKNTGVFDTVLQHSLISLLLNLSEQILNNTSNKHMQI